MKARIEGTREAGKSSGAVRVKDIGNKRVQIHGLHFYRQIRDLVPFDIAFIKPTQVYRAKINIPYAIIHFLECHLFSVKQVANIHHASAPVDHATALHLPYLKVIRVDHFR